LRELLAGFSSEKVNVIIQGIDSIPWNRISDLKKMACFRVLQELLVNMKKHSNASVVLLSFAKDGKRVKISYTDKGAAWSCSPGYDGPDKEHSPQWAEFAKTKAFNVIEA
jgi:signal transduction histidine kinase